MSNRQGRVTIIILTLVMLAVAIGVGLYELTARGGVSVFDTGAVGNIGSEIEGSALNWTQPPRGFIVHADVQNAQFNDYNETALRALVEHLHGLAESQIPIAGAFITRSTRVFYHVVESDLNPFFDHTNGYWGAWVVVKWQDHEGAVHSIFEADSYTPNNPGSNKWEPMQ